jgi:hypothetical protein
MTIIEDVLTNPVVTAVVGALVGGLFGVYVVPIFSDRATALRLHKRVVLDQVQIPLERERALQYNGNEPGLLPLVLTKLSWAPTQSEPARTFVQHLSDPTYSGALDAVRLAEAESAAKNRLVLVRVTAFETLIWARLFSLTTLPPWRGQSTQVQFLDHGRIRESLYSEISDRLWHTGGGAQPLVVTTPGTGGTEAALKWGPSTIGQGSKAELEAVSTVIQNLRTDEELETLVKDLISAEAARVDNRSRLEFERLREAAATRLAYKHESLRGKCALCPSWFRLVPLEREN